MPGLQDVQVGPEESGLGEVHNDSLATPKAEVVEQKFFQFKDVEGNTLELSEDFVDALDGEELQGFFQGLHDSPKWFNMV